MQYRELKISDYDKIFSFWQETAGVKLRDADSREGIEKYLRRNPGLSFVAEEKENIVGTIMSGHDGKRGYIQHLAVMDERRRSGIATELLGLCLEALRSEGILKAHIHVLCNNALARKFWANQGWIKRNDIEVHSFINGSSENT